MRRFAEFDAQAGAATVQRAEVARVRSLATWAYLWLVPGMCFVRQRSNFIQGWRAAAAAGASLAEGDSAGAVGEQGVPPLGSWMMLPDLTTPATQTVLPSNDALYGASHVELDLLGPVVVSVPANPDGRYYSVAIMDASMNNVGHIGPMWTGNGPSDHLVVPPGWAGEGPAGMPVIQAPTPSSACTTGCSSTIGRATWSTCGSGCVACGSPSCRSGARLTPPPTKCPQPASSTVTWVR